MSSQSVLHQERKYKNHTETNAKDDSPRPQDQNQDIFHINNEESGVTTMSFHEVPVSPSVFLNRSSSDIVTSTQFLGSGSKIGQPIQKKGDFVRRANGEERCCCFANWLFCFIFPYVCSCHPLTDKDLPVVHKNDKAKPATETFLNRYRESYEQYMKLLTAYKQRVEANPQIREKPPKRPGMMQMLIRTLSSFTFPVGFVVMLVGIAVETVQPLMSKGVLSAIIEKEKFNTSKGLDGSDKFPFFYVLWMIIAPLITSLFDANSGRLFFHFSARTRSAIVGAIYDKVFRIKNMASAGSADTGRILSLVAADARTVAEMLPMLIMLFGIPLYLIIPLIFLIFDFKWVAVIPLVVMILVVIPNSLLMQGMIKYVKSYMVFNDERNKITNETFQGIRVVKCSGLENVFKSTINVPREKQIHNLFLQSMLMQIMNAFMKISALAINIVTFSVYCAVFNDDPTHFAAVVIPNMGYLMMMAMPTTMLPNYLEAAMMIRININRLSQFLSLPEIDEIVVSDEARPANPDNALEIVNGEFKWGDAPPIPLTEAEETALKNEAIQRKRKATAAANPVEAAAEVGPSESNVSEYPSITPDVSSTSAPSRSRSRSTAFGSTTNADRPTLADINISIPKGSLTMVVGEVGCGKSSLGAAIVGDIGRVTGKVRMDGRISYCPQTAWITNDTVRENITFNADFNEVKYWNSVRACALESDLKIFAAGDETAIGEKGVNLSGGQKARIQLARAVYAENDIYILDDPLSAVDAHVGRYLMDNCICGVLKGKTVILMTNQLQFLDRANKIIVLDNGRITAQGTYSEIREQGVNFDEFIIESNQKTDRKNQKHVEVKEDEKTDEESAKQILTEEEQETGRIKLASYIKYLRTLMPLSLMVLFLVFEVICEGINPVSTWWMGKVGSTTAFPSLTFWWKIGIYGFLSVAVFVLMLLRALMTAKATSRSARINHNKLLDSVMNCPSSFFDTTPMGRILNRFTGDIPQIDQFLFSRFLQVIGMWVGLIGETITGAGLTTIRSFGREEVWKEKFFEVNDDLSVPFMLFREGQKWVSLYSAVISSLFFAGVMLIGWFFMDASKLSIAIMSSTAFSNMGLHLINMTVDLESKMTSFERVDFYTSKLPQEAKGHELEVPESWPERGDVTFENVNFRYRPGLPFVLKGVDFEIRGGEKIGVCGRTGAGKSSLLFALFRLVELDPKLAPKMIDMKTGFLVDSDPNEEPNSGRILIDGVDISKVDIHRVRRSVATIPQDPTLFTGTIRYNMDLAGHASDDRIWEVLEMIEMRDIVAGLPFGLDSQVAEGGSNFSAGQRQLLCFGRAILNNCRVVVMDEATANVDVETDAKIQRTIREQFREQTVIVIAHRLNTIMDSTRIMVMDQGSLTEFDTPDNLKVNPDSALNSLIQSLNH
ncbi:Multidrug resistance-associated protein [Blattamonas nauphoetae]|uniref:Multidrug resistance-associated protein n=1 Tax=Blattamonas nauphoetae TaxID=2049346 RepID=A0ABQ9Y300_9EUKA|nr:Multidrug resistance-associated protein [Blattamonas nauphoetae]